MNHLTQRQPPKPLAPSSRPAPAGTLTEAEIRQIVSEILG